MQQHSTQPIAFSLLIFFSIIFLTINHTQSIQSHTFIYSGCSQEKYQPNTPYETNLNSLLTSTITSSYQTLYNSFRLGNDPSAPQESSIFGLYQCRGDLKQKDCSICITNSIRQIVIACPYTYGATLVLDGCLVRYEHTDFLGKLDTGIRYNKCSGKSSNDAEFVRRKDGVLDDLGKGLGFRVSGAGSVEGYAQCLGDLSGDDCGSCLGEAIVKVRSLCGSADVAGEVFLAQCYVRYWDSGYYDTDADTSGNDGVGKTVAIIVGVVAGLAVLIVLLSVCRKALG